jgi:uncharacterized membrane protein YjjP (DUF1212 family)/uncharacterized membrane protein YjjB (DUF3815 family)
VLAISGGLLFALVRRTRNPRPIEVVLHPDAGTLTLEQGFATLEIVGEAMIDAGYSVNTVQESLEAIARVNGQERTEVVVMPTALFLTARDHVDVRTGVVASGTSPLLLHQLDALDRVVVAARLGQLSAAETRARVLAMREEGPPFGTAVRVLAAGVVSAALAVMLGGSWTSMGLAAVLGAGVGLAVIATATLRSTLQPLVTVGVAFICAVVVFLASRSGLDLVALPSVIAPLVVLLPGALLTTGVVELATGQMMSGAGRLAAGFMRLLLLAGGIVAGATLVGVPQITIAEGQYPLGPVAPWLAVAFFGVAVVVNRGGRLRFIPWIVLVLYVAYSAQVIGALFFSGVVAAFIGACAMTPVAILVSRFANAPASSVSFLPGFWLLVPGGLGLVGVTAVLDGGGNGLATLALTVATMVAIALGILTGSALGTGRRSGPKVLI